jgi:hypothetical protein
MGYGHITNDWNEYLATLSDEGENKRRNDPDTIAETARVRKEKAAKHVRYLAWEEEEKQKRINERIDLKRKNDEIDKRHMERNVIIQKHINELFSTPEGSGIIIKPSFGGASVDRPEYYLSIRMEMNGRDIYNGYFQVPLSMTQDATKIFLFLFREPNSDSLIPKPLASSVDTIMHGWLPIFNAIQQMTDWSRFTDIKRASHELSDLGTLQFRMEWITRYTSPLTRLQNNGFSYNDYNDKAIYIFSWVKDNVPWFELHMPKHLNYKLKETYQQKFQIGDIQALIAQLQSQFSVSNPLNDGYSALSNRVAQMTTLLKKRPEGP